MKEKERCQILKTCFCTNFFKILVVVSYFSIGIFLMWWCCIIHYPCLINVFSKTNTLSVLFGIEIKASLLGLSHAYSYYYGYTVVCSKKLLSWVTPKLLLCMNKFSTRKMTTPKCRTRSSNLEACVVICRKLIWQGQCSTLITVEYTKGISVRFLHCVNCNHLNNVHELLYTIVSQKSLKG